MDANNALIAFSFLLIVHIYIFLIKHSRENLSCFLSKKLSVLMRCKKHIAHMQKDEGWSNRMSCQKYAQKEYHPEGLKKTEC
jgi:hypothetical protein